MEAQGLVKAIRQCQEAGAALIGICGGYQMLGAKIYDPEMVESQKTELAGLGLLPMTTVFAGSKETHRIRGTVVRDAGLLAGAKGLPIQGYEIHMGRTTGDGLTAPFSIEDRSDLAVTEDTATDGALHAAGYIFGTYIHGLFHNGGLRRAILQALAQRKGVSLPLAAGDLGIDQEYDKLADWVRSSLDMDLIYRMTDLTRDFEAAGDPG